MRSERHFFALPPRFPLPYLHCLVKGTGFQYPIQYLGQRLDVCPIHQRTEMEVAVMHQTMTQIPWPLRGYYHLTDWGQVGSAGC